MQLGTALHCFNKIIIYPTGRHKGLVHVLFKAPSYTKAPSAYFMIHLGPKAHADGRDIVGQQHATLLGPTCCVRFMEPQQCWHLLALVAYSLKPVKPFGPCKRTQHCWPATRNNKCCDLLRPFARGFYVHTNTLLVFIKSLYF